MKDFNYTPGPWVICDGTQENVVEVCDTRSSEDKKTTVCGVYGTFDVSELANAKLIAAAPDLHSALSTLIFLHTCEQEGMASGRPTAEQWRKAYEKGVKALEKVK